NPIGLQDPTGLGPEDNEEDKRWFDVSADAIWGPVARYDRWLGDRVLWLPVFGNQLYVQGTFGLHMLAGLLRLPARFAHDGRVFGCFWGHPSWETAPGLIGDIGTTMMVAGFSYGL